MNLPIMKTASKTAADIFGRNNIKAVSDLQGHVFETKYKVVVFVPAEKLEELTFTMAASGAGVIGNYSVCSFSTKGTGTFLGGKRSNPAVGKKGRLETVEEVKLEMICDPAKLGTVTGSVYNVHPYEEPAIEIYRVLVPKKVSSVKTGLFTLKRSVHLKSVFSKLIKVLNPSVLPAVHGRIKIKKAVIDLAEDPGISFRNFEKDILLIRKTRNTLTIEIL